MTCFNTTGAAHFILEWRTTYPGQRLLVFVNQAFALALIPVPLKGYVFNKNGCGVKFFYQVKFFVGQCIATGSEGPHILTLYFVTFLALSLFGTKNTERKSCHFKIRFYTNQCFVGQDLRTGKHCCPASCPDIQTTRLCMGCAAWKIILLGVHYSRQIEKHTKYGQNGRFQEIAPISKIPNCLK